MNNSQIHQDVTNKIVAAMEADPGQWTKPWSTNGRPKNATTGRRYSGVNILLLGLSGASKGYPSGLWASYKQWQGVGAQVNVGEKGTAIVYASTFTPKDAEPDTKSIAFLKSSSVFNAAQVDGYTAEEAAPVSTVQRIKDVDQFTHATGADVRHGGDRAYYSLSQDFIGMPEPSSFKDTATATATEGMYGTLLHELTHWTGHKSRCDREFGKRFGTQAYAAEELVAELGASFLCAGLGLAAEPRPDHAQYLNSWIRLLKADKRAIFTAASKASQAVEWLEQAQDETQAQAA
jgi:antirestriction protein ArdC